MQQGSGAGVSADRDHPATQDDQLPNMENKAQDFLDRVKSRLTPDKQKRFLKFVKENPSSIASYLRARRQRQQMLQHSIRLGLITGFPQMNYGKGLIVTQPQQTLPGINLDPTKRDPNVINMSVQANVGTQNSTAYKQGVVQQESFQNVFKQATGIIEQMSRSVHGWPQNITNQPSTSGANIIVPIQNLPVDNQNQIPQTAGKRLRKRDFRKPENHRLFCHKKEHRTATKSQIIAASCNEVLPSNIQVTYDSDGSRVYIIDLLPEPGNQSAADKIKRSKAALVQGTKEWQQSVGPDLRTSFIQKLVQAFLSTVDPNTVVDQKINDKFSDNAKKIESDLYKLANSRSEYYHLLAEKNALIRGEKAREN